MRLEVVPVWHKQNSQQLLMTIIFGFARRDDGRFLFLSARKTVPVIL